MGALIFLWAGWGPAGCGLQSGAGKDKAERVNTSTPELLFVSVLLIGFPDNIRFVIKRVLLRERRRKKKNQCEQLVVNWDPQWFASCEVQVQRVLQ